MSFPFLMNILNDVERLAIDPSIFYDFGQVNENPQRENLSPQINSHRLEQNQQNEEEKNSLIVNEEQYLEEDLKWIREKNLICAICQNIISSTVTRACCAGFHAFCDNCIIKHMRTCINQGKNPSCPTCRTSLPNGMNSLIFDEHHTKQLNECMVQCINHANENGCFERVKRKDYVAHISVCPFQKMKCKQCSSWMYFKDEKEHQTVCPMKLVKCEACHEMVPNRLINVHRQKHCSMQVISCPNLYCNVSCERIHLPDHLLTCSYRMVKCELNCGATIPLDCKEKHEKVCEMRTLNCKDCQMKLFAKDKTSHNEQCYMKMETCRFCSLSLKRFELSKHVCPTKIMKCEKCSHPFCFQDKETHESKQCLRRIVQCKKCHQRFEYQHYHVHKTKECPMISISCSYCGASIQKKMEGKHLTLCPDISVSCTYQKYGCSSTFPRKDELAHMNNNTHIHLKLLEQYIHTH